MIDCAYVPKLVRHALHTEFTRLSWHCSAIRIQVDSAISRGGADGVCIEARPGDGLGKTLLLCSSAKINPMLVMQISVIVIEIHSSIRGHFSPPQHISAPDLVPHEQVLYV